MGKYCCYQITNKINGKFYRGKSTVARIKAGYFGSGLRLWEAISKYGKQNFSLEILKEFETEEEAFSYEKEIVVLDLKKSYNLKPGGRGGKAKLVWIYKDQRQIRVDPCLVEDLLKEGYQKGQIPGHLDNFRKASIAPEVQAQRKKTKKLSGTIDRWSALMRSSEIRKKAAEHSLESRKLGGELQKWIEAGKAPEVQKKRQQTINRKKSVVRTKEFKQWYLGKEKQYKSRPHSAVRDFLNIVNKSLLDYQEYE